MIDEKMLEDAVAEALAKGWSLQDGITIEGTCCCPIGALRAKDYAPGGDFPCFEDPGHIGRDFGMSFDEANAFANGFDDYSAPVNDRAPHAFALGCKFRQKYLKGADK